MTRPAPLSRARELLRRVAHVGFWFFLIKGLLWLVVPVIAIWAGWRGDWF